MLIKKFKKGITFSVSDRILWIFYLILFYSLDSEKNLEKLSNKDTIKIKINLKNLVNLKYYKDLFNLIDLDVFFYSNNYIFSNLYSTLLYYLYILPNKYFIKNIYILYFFNFKNYLNILNVYFIPNYVYRTISFFFLKKKKILNEFNSKYSSNIGYFYNNYSFNSSYFCFLNILKYLNYKYIYNLNILIDCYSNIINNIFYKDFKDFFIYKNINNFITSWSENNKKFFINIASTVKKNEEFYVQKRLITNYSSIKFTNSLGLSKNYLLSFSIKIIMIQHFRRMLLSSNIMNFFIFLKNYIKDFKFIYLNLKYSLNEIFINPINNSIICDIFINYKKSLNILEYMGKYKNYIMDLLNIKDESQGLVQWNFFLDKFLNSLVLIPNIFINKNNLNLQKILIRYYLDCNVIFIFNKKLFPLKKKKSSIYI